MQKRKKLGPIGWHAPGTPPRSANVIDNNAVIVIEKSYVLVSMAKVGDDIPWTKRMPKNAKIRDLKEVILHQIFGRSISDVSIYLKMRNLRVVRFSET